MFIFTGKFNYYFYANNDNITFVVPGVLASNQPIWGLWQWSSNDKGQSKQNSGGSGKLTSVGNPGSDGTRAIAFSFGFYSFTGTIGANVSNLKLTMNDRNNHSSGPWTLPLLYSDGTQTPYARVYTGKLNWFDAAQNEMVMLVLPSGLGMRAPATLVFQWTQDRAGTKKAPYAINSLLRDYSVGADGTVKASFKEYDASGVVGYYSYKAEFDQGGQTIKLMMTDREGNTDSRSPYTLSLVASP